MNNDEEFGDIGPLVVAASRSVPDYFQDLPRVRRAGQTRRRRRTIGAFAAALAVMATTAGVAVALPSGGGGGAVSGRLEQIEPAAAPAAPTMAQIMFIRASGYFAGPSPLPPGTETKERHTPADYPPGSVGMIGYHGMMLADGTFKDLPKVPGVPSEHIVPVPGGGWAIKGLVDLAPGVSREDGPCVSDISTPLIIVDKDGKQTFNRDIHRRCHVAGLIGVHSGRAFLTRDGNIMALDLSTGNETFFKPGLRGWATLDGDVIYGFDSRSDQCHNLVLRTVNIVTGAENNREITTRTCDYNHEFVRLSPDGRRIAFGHYVGQEIQQPVMAVSIADVATGAIVATHQFPNLTGQKTIHANLGGLAWVDDDTVRIAYANPPATGVVYYRDVAKTFDLSV